MAKTILIVDDSATMREMISFALNDAGYGVISAVHGRDALNKLNNTTVDLVITGLDMPIMDGVEFIKQLRASPGYKFMPVIMLTTASQESKRLEGKQEGASGWIMKPFTAKQLKHTIGLFVK